MTRRILTGALGLGLACTLPLAACGDDDDTASDDFCDIAETIAASEEQPSDDVLDEFADAAPDEIEDEVQSVVDAVKDEGDAAFDDPDVVDDLDEINAYEAANCDFASSSDDSDDEPTGDTTEDTTGTTLDDSTGTTTDVTLDDGTSTTVEDTVSTMTG